MADEQLALAARDRPRLQSFVRLQYDGTRERWVLQAPERVLVLDETGKEILEHCDGEATIGEIIAGLAKEYDAPKDVIAQDVLAVLNLLAGKGLLVIEAEAPGDGDD